MSRASKAKGRAGRAKKKRRERRHAAAALEVPRAATSAAVPVAHWAPDEWRENLDDVVVDRAHPQAFPSTYPMDLMGRIRVKLAVEDQHLVAYGFGGQRIVMPHESLGSIVTVSRYYLEGREEPLEDALLVLDRASRVLLRADGQWDTYGEVLRVCKAARLPDPKHQRYQPGRSMAQVTQQGVSSYRKAPGYRRLRVHTYSEPLRKLAFPLLYLVTICAGIVPGGLLLALLPGWFGVVRLLLVIVALVLGMAGGAWAGGAIAHAWTDALRWAAASWTAKTLAPTNRFFRPRPERSSAWQDSTGIGLAVLFAALTAWGPGVGLVTLMDGLHPLANLISGAVCTLALLPLGLYLARRWRRRRLQDADGLIAYDESEESD